MCLSLSFSFSKQRFDVGIFVFSYLSLKGPIDIEDLLQGAPDAALITII